jgi:stage V sporulation protein R
MLLDTLYHPPHITVDKDKMKDNGLYLYHHFEGKPLVNEFIANTMLGIEYLWGGAVQLETSDVVAAPQTVSTTVFAPKPAVGAPKESEPKAIKWQRAVYTMKNRTLSRKALSS